jgi:hypothetical protein
MNSPQDRKPMTADALEYYRRMDGQDAYHCDDLARINAPSITGLDYALILLAGGVAALVAMVIGWGVLAFITALNAATIGF